MNETTPELILQFLSYKGAIQNCSPLTVSEYHRDIDLFFRFLLSQKKGCKPEEAVLADIDAALVQSVRAEDIYAFLLYLVQQRGDKAPTVARKLSAIKAFFKYHTTKSHLLQVNPARDIDAPKLHQTLPKYLTLNESLRLLEGLDKNDLQYQRDYCILTLFLNCGMRLSELVGINLTDMDSEMQKLTVTGKGNKMRTIYLNDACRDAIRAYLSVRQKNAALHGKPITDSSKNALFLSSRNQRISKKTVQWLVYRHLEESGLSGRGFSTHKLRHTAATLMYNEGNVDVRTLKDILGHEQLNTTQIYTHVSDKKLEEAMKANPLSAIKPGNADKTNPNNKL